ncbi:MAG: hypothetical protein AAB791_00765 [Patescibacteria group bacterium]
MAKITKIKYAIYAVLLILGLVFLVWWFFYNSAKGRDYQRLGEAKVIESAMNDYFLEFNTYAVPGCNSNMDLMECQGQGDRILKINQLKYKYTVSEMSEENFRINFTFEIGVAGLPSGVYVLTKEGLGK